MNKKEKKLIPIISELGYWSSELKDNKTVKKTFKVIKFSGTVKANNPIFKKIK